MISYDAVADKHNFIINKVVVFFICLIDFLLCTIDYLIYTTATRNRPVPGVGGGGGLLHILHKA